MGGAIWAHLPQASKLAFSTANNSLMFIGPAVVTAAEPISLVKLEPFVAFPNKLVSKKKHLHDTVLNLKQSSIQNTGLVRL